MEPKTKPDIKDLQEALRYAGKLAMASKSVINSEALYLSLRIEILQKKLQDYNNYILKL